jgi:hypothetical protein
MAPWGQSATPSARQNVMADTAGRRRSGDYCKHDSPAP